MIAVVVVVVVVVVVIVVNLLLLNAVGLKEIYIFDRHIYVSIYIYISTNNYYY